VPRGDISGPALTPTSPDLLGDLAALGPFFAVSSHLPGRSPEAPWCPVSQLTSLDGSLHARISAIRAALASRGGRPIEEIDVRAAASAAHLGLVARLTAPALGAAVLGYRIDMDPAGLWWQEQTGGPVPLSVPARIAGLGPAGLAPGPVSPEWDRPLLDEVLAPVTTAVALLVPVSSRVLWGNVASAANSAAGQLARQRSDLASQAWRAAACLLGRPQLRGERHLPGPGFRRSSCCLFYRLEPGASAAICGDCVLQER
jgi:hypothetical protein